MFRVSPEIHFVHGQMSSLEKLCLKPRVLSGIPTQSNWVMKKADASSGLTIILVVAGKAYPLSQAQDVITESLRVGRGGKLYLEG